jgi:hypothetical protein
MKTDWKRMKLTNAAFIFIFFMKAKINIETPKTGTELEKSITGVSSISCLLH